MLLVKHIETTGGNTPFALISPNSLVEFSETKPRAAVVPAEHKILSAGRISHKFSQTSARLRVAPAQKRN